MHRRAQLLFVALLILPAARAQQPAPLQSNPAGPIAPLPPITDDQNGRSLPAIGTLPETSYDQSSQQVEPYTSFLSGAEIFGLGSLYGLRHSIDAAFQFSESRSTGLVAARPLSTTGVGASLNVDQHRARYRLRFMYNGLENIYEPSFYGVHNLPYHNGAISQEILLGRWTLRLRDDVLYSWGSSFSGVFTGGTFQVGNNMLTAIQPSLASSATIQTGLSQQLNNTALAEVDYSFSRRTTVVLVGTYSLMHFFDLGYLNSHGSNGQLGYNYALSAKNNIGLTYDYNRTSFSGTSGRLQGNSFQLAFGRKVTGRLAFQVAAGPQLLAVTNLGLSNSRQLSWSAFTAVSYQWHRSAYAVSYFHGVTAGSGVYLGSTGQTVTVSLTQAITRSWSASVNGGYATNKGLQPVPGYASYFNDWFGFSNLGRQIGPQVRLSATYGYQQQTRGTASCPVSNCALPGSFSQLGVSLQWHPPLRGK